MKCLDKPFRSKVVIARMGKGFAKVKNTALVLRKLCKPSGCTLSREGGAIKQLSRRCLAMTFVTGQQGSRAAGRVYVFDC